MGAALETAAVTESHAPVVSGVVSIQLPRVTRSRTTCGLPVAGS